MASRVEDARVEDWYLATALTEIAPDPATPPEARAHQTLAAIREARFGPILRCPRCGSGDVRRWGHFGMRRRYRCTQCRRTFSDLTGTAFAYGKRLDLWLPYAACLFESVSVRTAARRLGIDKDTAWRWRHRLLAAHAHLPTRPLAGTAELVERRFGICQKGRRDVVHPLRRATRFYPGRRPSVVVLFMRDERGATAAAIAGPFPLRWDALQRVLAPRATGLRGLVAPYGPTHPIALFADHHRLMYQRTALDHLRDGRHVMDDVVRFRTWLERFRGVATRYLDRYLHWHAILGRIRDPRLALLREVGRAPPGTGPARC